MSTEHDKITQVPAVDIIPGDLSVSADLTALDWSPNRRTRAQRAAAGERKAAQAKETERRCQELREIRDGLRISFRKVGELRWSEMKGVAALLADKTLLHKAIGKTVAQLADEFGDSERTLEMMAKVYRTFFTGKGISEELEKQLTAAPWSKAYVLTGLKDTEHWDTWIPRLHQMTREELRAEVRESNDKLKHLKEGAEAVTSIPSRIKVRILRCLDQVEEAVAGGTLLGPELKEIQDRWQKISLAVMGARPLILAPPSDPTTAGYPAFDNAPDTAGGRRSSLHLRRCRRGRNLRNRLGAQRPNPVTSLGGSTSG